MKTSDEKLNQLLRSAAPVPQNLGLAQRIISKSIQEASTKACNESKAINKESLLKQIINSFIIPKPGYALACSMLVGILFGWQSNAITEAVVTSNIASELGINLRDESTLQTASVEEDLNSLFLAEVNYYE
tara:strand:+ start:675 stop:1067 length:393 start_codon:yes stop_codon:yes gene_type:complete